MKCSPQVEAIGQDALFLIAKATELFIQYLSGEVHRKGGKSSLDYKVLAEIVQSSEILEFLRQIIPRKITLKQFNEMMEERNASATSSDSSDTESDSSSDGDSDSGSDSNSNSKRSESERSSETETDSEEADSDK